MTKANRNYRNWYMVEEDGICWLYFDKREAAANVLSAKVLSELDSILIKLAIKKIKGLVILSAKRSGFIAGADINDFIKVQNLEEAEKLIRRGQSVFNRIEELPFPTVALIHGFCLGGGLELALACRYRVAKDDMKTQLGLPEVKLGIHPGFGGTVRLPRLIGAPAAMGLILTGKAIDVHKAKRAGIIDYIVPERHLKDMAVKCITDKPKVHTPSLLQRLSNKSLIRPVIKRLILKKARAKINHLHYPAPFAAINLWSEFANLPQTMMGEEARSAAKLLTGETSRNLVRVFFLRNRLKSIGKTNSFRPPHVHIIGSGTMGGDIAAWCALHGYKVTVKSRKPESIASALLRANKLFIKKLKVPRLVRQAMDRMIPDTAGEGIKKADIVIEAVMEDAEVKRKVFRDIEPLMKRDAVLATNTSSIPLEELAPALSQPDRLVGLHFFNPVSRMPLVEIIKGKLTNEETTNKALAFTLTIDHLPLPVRSSAGFLVNRILMPYLIEAVHMVEEGIAPEDIDRTATDFGMPMGPVILADTVGLDVCLHAAEIISGKIPMDIPAILRNKVNDGSFGLKSGQGFYRYEKGRKTVKARHGIAHEKDDLQDRLILRLINAAVQCIHEDIVEDADLLDAAMIFSTGFAPFRGGPVNYCRSEGIEHIRNRLGALQEKYGERFRPSPGWNMIADTGNS